MNIHGCNMAGAVDHYGAVPSFDLVQKFISAGVRGFRFPGGAKANEWQLGSDELPRMMALSKRVGAGMMWVANLNAAPSDVITVLGMIRNEGIPILGCAMHNEGYLGQYKDLFPNPAAYLNIAENMAAAIHSHFPDVKVGVNLAPSADMKDFDSASTPAKRLLEWNNAVIAGSPWAQAFEVHSYAPADSARAHRRALVAFAKALPTDKELWVGEWNIHGAEYGGKRIQSDHYERMRELLPAFADLDFLHNGLAHPVGYNLIRALAKDNYRFTPLGVTASKF